jgi:hypothetical protein
MVKDIRKYRRQYYQDNKEYLLAYQRWYYSTRRYEAGLIKLEDVKEKPCPSTRKYSKQKKQEKMMTIKNGTFILVFD